MGCRQEFTRERNGTVYTVVVTVGGEGRRPVLQVVLNWWNGFGGGSRRLPDVPLGVDDAARVIAGLRGEMPCWALADVLVECGADVGVSNTVRGG